MKTSDLLDTVADDMLDDRPALISGSGDQLWSNKKIIKYLNEAERILCREAWVLEDINPASVDGDGNKVCQLQWVGNQTDYALHKSILLVKAARHSDTTVDMQRVGYDDNRIWPSTFLSDPTFWDVNLPLTENPGRPQRFSTDQGVRILRMRPAPDPVLPLIQTNLMVVRMPLVEMSEDDLDKEPEVPEEFHLDLTLFAAGACITRTADVDAQLQRKGREWMDEFDKKWKAAKRDKQRFKQSPPRFRFGGWVNQREQGTSQPGA